MEGKLPLPARQLVAAFCDPTLCWGAVQLCPRFAVRANARCGLTGALRAQLELFQKKDMASYRVMEHAMSVGIRSGHVSCVKLLMPYIFSHNHYGALGLAASCGHVECVKQFLPPHVREPIDGGATALQEAAGKGHVDCVRLLIPYMFSNSALMEAANGGHVDCFNLLFPLCSDVEVQARAICALHEAHRKKLIRLQERIAVRLT